MFLVIHFLLSFQVLLSCGELILQRNPGLENWFPNTPLTTVGVVKSKMHCGRQCLKTGCMSIVYETVTNVCHLNDIISRNISECSWKPNTVQYKGVSRMSNGYDCSIFTEGCFKLLTTKHTWSDGRAACAAEGASLLQIDSIGEQLAIQRIMEVGSLDYAWHGINDLVQEGAWRTENGAVPTFTYFHYGQPDNFLNIQNCGVVKQYYGYMWDDVDCSSIVNVICEI